MAYKIFWTPEKKETAIQKLTEYFEKYGPGECIMQGDDPILEAPEVMADIADDVLIEGEGLVWEES
jgi:hypothetical protein